MSWHDDVAKTYLFHKQKQEEKGEGQTGRPRKGEKKSGWAIRDTAETLKVSVRQVVEDLKLWKVISDTNYVHLSRKDALLKLQGKETKVDKVKFLKDSIVAALGWLSTGKKNDVKKAEEILNKAVE